MSRKIYSYFIAIVVSTAFVVPTNAQNLRQSGQASLPVRVVEANAPVLLGQDEPAKKPGLFERMKRSIANWAKDDDFDDAAPQKTLEEKTKPQPTVSVPTRPPKPVRATEVRQAVDHPDQPVERQTTTERRTATNQENRFEVVNTSQKNVSIPTAEEAETTPVVQDETIFERLKQIREQVFDKQEIDEDLGDRETARSNPRTAPSPAQFDESRTVRQMPSTRTPPPRTTLIDTPAPRRTLTESVVPRDEEFASERSSTEEPIPLRSRTRRETASEAMEQVAENTGHQRVSPSPRADRAIEPYETTTIASNHSRTAPLSGVEVERTPHRSRATPRMRDAQTLEPTRSTTPVHRRQEISAKGDEYQIAARRMLVTERDETSPETIETTKPESLVSDTVSTETPPVSREPEKTLLVSPRLEVETESDPRAIVGQEAIYKIRVHNRGDGAAEQVVLSVEVPNWIDIRQPDVSAGTTSIVPRSDTKEVRDFTWKISRIEAGSDTLLVLRLVPQQRKSIDLKIRYDFFKPAAVTKLIVQEPIIEMELEGPDEVLWGTKVGYRLLVRNTGNGDAENVKLELLQTGSDMKSCELPLLKAGEEQVIDVDVWTGKQEHIDINIQATGMYDLETKVSKRVKVMRPNVLMTVDTPTVQFVGSSAEFVIKVRNVGNAPAKDIELAATLPLGARFDSCSEGGEATAQNQVLWKIDSIPIGEVFTATIVCEPKREGACKLEAAVNDKSGVLANCSSAFEATAIVELKLDVETPQGPIEVGREAVYTLNLVNRGTKAAENVDVSVFFGKHLEPYAIEGGTAYTSDGQVVFDKIPTIGPEQHLTLKVKARADEAGSHRIRSEVNCSTAEINLVNEQATYFYKKQKGKSTASSLNELKKPVSEELRTVPSEPSAVQTIPEKKQATDSIPVPAMITPTPLTQKSESLAETPTLIDPFLQ